MGRKVVQTRLLEVMVALKLLEKYSVESAEVLKETEQDPVNRGPEREVGVLVLVTEGTD